MTTKKYRGYIILNEKSNDTQRWCVKFPDFPTIEIFGGNNFLDTFGIVNEICFGKILDYVVHCIKSGIVIPEPHEPFNRKPYIEIEIDIDLISANFKINKLN